MYDEQKVKTVAVLTLGCSKNMVDSESLIAALEKTRIKFIDNPTDADAVLVNTCGFVESAKEESINLILTLSELKRKKKIKKLSFSVAFRKDIPTALKIKYPT